MFYNTLPGLVVDIHPSLLLNINVTIRHTVRCNITFLNLRSCLRAEREYIMQFRRELLVIVSTST